MLLVQQLQLLLQLLLQCLVDLGQRAIILGLELIDQALPIRTTWAAESPSHRSTVCSVADRELVLSEI